MKYLSRIQIAFFLALYFVLLLLLSADMRAQSQFRVQPVVDPRGIAFLPALNKVYVSSGSGNWVKAFDHGLVTEYANISIPGRPDFIAANPNTNRIYVATTDAGAVTVIDGTNNSVIATIAIGGHPGGPGSISVDVQSNRIWVSEPYSANTFVIDGATNSILATLPGYSQAGTAILPGMRQVYIGNSISYEADTLALLGPIQQQPPYFNFGAVGMVADTNLNKVYFSHNSQAQLDVIDGATNSFVYQLFNGDGYAPGALAINVLANRLYVGWSRGSVIGIYDLSTLTRMAGDIEVGGSYTDLAHGVASDASTGLVYVWDVLDQKITIFRDDSIPTDQTPVGPNAVITVGTTDFYFDNVITPGTTTVTPIDPATAGDVPGGFSLLDLAFEVHTTATFSGSVESCFKVTGVNDEEVFNSLQVLHNEGGQLIPVETYRDFANQYVCAVTTSFSPFYIARSGNKIQSLFDRTRAFKSGSTVPVKVRILNSGDQDISAATLPLSVRGLRRIGSSTASEINDAGTSNSDFTFRYDAELHGYIYNLKTTGLMSGKYVLSLFAGNDHTFMYTVTFDIK